MLRQLLRQQLWFAGARRTSCAVQIAALRTPVRSVQTIPWSWKFQPAPAPSVCVHEFFVAQANRAPDQTAVLFQDRSLTYGELNERSNALASLLIDLGVKRGDFVGSLLPRSEDIVTTLIAIFKLGAIYVPLDETYPALHLKHYAATTDLRFVVSNSATLPKLPSFHQDGKALLLNSANVQEVLRRGVSDAKLEEKMAGSRALLEDVAYAVFTSGSTGEPKPILQRHHGLTYCINHWLYMGLIDGRTTMMAPTATSFTVSMLELWTALCHGMRIVIPTACRIEPYWFREVINLIEKHNGQIMHAVPVIWRELFKNGWRGGQDFCAISLGENPTIALAEQLARSCGTAYNCYGASEANNITFFQLPRDCSHLERIPAGKFAPNVYGRLVDDEGNEVTEIGKVGQLRVAGPCVALGYLNRDEYTRQRFKTIDTAAVAKQNRHHATLLQGWEEFLTGDVGRFDADGNLTLIGRADDQINLQGLRIEPVAVAKAILAQPGIKEVVVLARDEHLFACVSPKMSVDELKALQVRLLDYLPPYHVPTLWHTVEEGRLPRTPNGKVDKVSLRLKPFKDLVMLDEILSHEVLQKLDKA